MGHSVFCFCRKHTNHEVLDRRCPRGCCRCRCRLRLWRIRLRPQLRWLWPLLRLDSDRRTEEVSRHFLIFRHKLFSMKMPKTLKKKNSWKYEIVKKKKKKKKK